MERLATWTWPKSQRERWQGPGDHLVDLHFAGARGRKLATFLRSHWKGHGWDGDLGPSCPVLDSECQLPERPEPAPGRLGASAWMSPSLGILCWQGCLVVTRDSQGSPPGHFRRFAPNSEPITHRRPLCRCPLGVGGTTLEQLVVTRDSLTPIPAWRLCAAPALQYSGAPSGLSTVSTQHHGPLDLRDGLRVTHITLWMWPLTRDLKCSPGNPPDAPGVSFQVMPSRN